MRIRLLVLLVFSLLGLKNPLAAPRCRPVGPPWLEGRVVGARAPAARAVDARRGETIEVLLVLPGTLDGKPVVFREDARPGGAARSWTGEGCGPLEVSWRRVEPRMQHTATPAPNPDVPIYSNAVVFGPSHGQWIGYDRIEYFERPLDGASGPRIEVKSARPSEAAVVQGRAPEHLDLGTMRLAATVRAGGAPLSTPGAADAPAGLIADRVLRYSFRSGDDLVGWMTSFFNVPYLFGSAGQGTKNQAERYLGTDCADIIVAALRRAGKKTLDYSSVEGLVDSLKRVAGPTVIAPPCGADVEPHSDCVAETHDNVRCSDAFEDRSGVHRDCVAETHDNVRCSDAFKDRSGVHRDCVAETHDNVRCSDAFKDRSGVHRDCVAGSEKRLPWGPAGIQPGDILALDYVGAAVLPRAWDHIGVLVEDRAPGGTLPGDGLLGPEDLFADSGDASGLKLAPLGEQGTVRALVLRARSLPAR